VRRGSGRMPGRSGGGGVGRMPGEKGCCVGFIKDWWRGRGVRIGPYVGAYLYIYIYCLLELNMLCDCVTRVAVTTPPSRPPLCCLLEFVRCLLV
jgi:hypothetical protein